MANNLGNLTIGLFAKAAGVNVETIRFYQRKGLLPEPDKPYGSGHETFPFCAWQAHTSSDYTASIRAKSAIFSRTSLSLCSARLLASSQWVPSSSRSSSAISSRLNPSRWADYYKFHPNHVCAAVAANADRIATGRNKPGRGGSGLAR